MFFCIMMIINYQWLYLLEEGKASTASFFRNLPFLAGRVDYRSVALRLVLHLVLDQAITAKFNLSYSTSRWQLKPSASSPPLFSFSSGAIKGGKWSSTLILATSFSCRQSEATLSLILFLSNENYTSVRSSLLVLPINSLQPPFKALNCSWSSSSMMVPKLLSIFYICCLILALLSVSSSFRARNAFLLVCISLSNCLSSSILISVSLRINASMASILRAIPRVDRSTIESSCSQQAQLASTSLILVLSLPTTASRRSFLSYYWAVSSRSTFRPQRAMLRAQLLQYLACGWSRRKKREGVLGWFLQGLGRRDGDGQDYIQRLNQ